MGRKKGKEQGADLCHERDGNGWDEHEKNCGKRPDMDSGSAVGKSRSQGIDGNGEHKKQHGYHLDEHSATSNRILLNLFYHM